MLVAAFMGISFIYIELILFKFVWLYVDNSDFEDVDKLCKRSLVVLAILAVVGVFLLFFTIQTYNKNVDKITSGYTWTQK